jgi:hypothetical protein
MRHRRSAGFLVFGFIRCGHLLAAAVVVSRCMVQRVVGVADLVAGGGALYIGEIV